MLTLAIIYAALFGLCFGSFANVLIGRLPKGGSVVSPPSHCDACGRRLEARDLIPVLSWLLLRGRCRFCKERISPRVPAVELGCAILFVCVTAHTGPDISAVPLCALAFTLLCVSCIDADTCEIPDGLIIFGSSVGIVWVIISIFMDTGAPAWHDALLGAFCGAAPLFLIDRLSLLLLKKDGFGYGDVKLMAMAGLFLGWKLAFVSLFFAVVAGGAYAAFLLISRRAERGAYLAFGPFLSAGVIAALWFGQRFLELMFR